MSSIILSPSVELHKKLNWAWSSLKTNGEKRSLIFSVGSSSFCLLGLWQLINILSTLPKRLSYVSIFNCESVVSKKSFRYWNLLFKALKARLFTLAICCLKLKRKWTFPQPTTFSFPSNLLINSFRVSMLLVEIWAVSFSF